MELRNKLTLFLILSCYSVSCFPSRPLNDRPSELTWQAWLLVDSQNQLQNESDRRITPKSVFIAPKLGQRNDTLPDCADGYRADSMGRCIKFVKVDETAHLNFLLSRLNEMYGENVDEDFEESEEGLPTAGPLQVNIPLGLKNDNEDPDNKSPDLPLLIERFSDKLDIKRDPDNKKVEKPCENYDCEDNNETTTEIFTTTEEIKFETTTEYETTTDITTTEITTTEIPTTTEMNEDDDTLKALFFLIPTKNETTSQESTTKLVPNDSEFESQRVVENIFNQQYPMPSLINIKLDNEETTKKKEEYLKQQWYAPDIPTYQREISTLKSIIQNDEQQFLHKQELPNKEIAQPFINKQETDIRTPIIRFPQEYIRFPEEYPANVKPNYPPVQRPNQDHTTQERIQDFFRKYINRNERPHFSSVIYNHRNRDRNDNLWGLTPTILNEKPLPQRYERYPTNYQNREVQFYGQDSDQGYTNNYGRKRRRGNLR